MKQYFFITLLILVSSLSIGQRKISNNQELVFRKVGFLVDQFEKVGCRASGDFCQFIIKNSRNEVELLIYSRFVRFDSLISKTNIYGDSYFLEFVFTDKFLRSQVSCTEKQVFNSDFVKKLVITLCDSFPGGDGGPPTYGLNDAWVKEFIKEHPVRYFK